MGTDVTRSSSVKELYKRAWAYDIPSEQVNGMDVLEVREVTAKAARKVRKGEGPYFLELKTFRYRAHSMADPGRYRTLEEESVWRERDPIETYSRYLVKRGICDPCELTEVKNQVEQEVKNAVKFGDESPNPRMEMLTKFVYTE